MNPTADHPADPEGTSQDPASREASRPDPPRREGQSLEGQSLDVWAPLAHQVSVRLGDHDHPMRPRGDGWWTPAELPDGSVAAGAEYAYLLDGDPTPLPDPRSRFQPRGVHGPSQLFDPGAHRWRDGSWPGRTLEGSIIYELHVGTFTPEGTLDAAIDRLDHVVSLGVGFVEVMPVNAFDGTHNWGYDGVLWWSVDDSYGGPAAYQRFVDACHSRGLGVIQDVVYNHLGPHGNHLPRFAPYLRTDGDTLWGAAVNFDEPGVRRYVLDNAAMWLRDLHVDGLRLDAVHAMIDRSPVHILEQLTREVAALSVEVGRPLTVIAESDLNDPTLITPRRLGGYGVDAQWNDDFHHALHVALTGEVAGYYADFEQLDSLAKVMTGGFFHDGTYSSFRRRHHGAPLDTATTPAWRLVVADQTHDQVGNRAVGDRLAATLTDGQLGIAAVVLLTSPFTPMLFMGEEWAASTPWQYFTSHTEPALAAATAAGRLHEFEQMGWDPDTVPDPQSPTTFLASKLDWSELADGRHARLLDLYRSLGRMRRARPDLRDAGFATVRCELDPVARWFVVHRSETSVLVNFAADPVTLPCTGDLLLATGPGVVVDDATRLPGHSAAVLART